MCQYLIMRFYIIILVTIMIDMRLRQLREEFALNQSDVAKVLNIRQNTYSQYENGQRQIPIPALIALAKYYKTSTDYILGLTDNDLPY